MVAASVCCGTDRLLLCDSGRCCRLINASLVTDNPNTRQGTSLKTPTVQETLRVSTTGPLPALWQCRGLAHMSYPGTVQCGAQRFKIVTNIIQHAVTLRLLDAHGRVPPEKRRLESSLPPLFSTVVDCGPDSSLRDETKPLGDFLRFCSDIQFDHFHLPRLKLPPGLLSTVRSKEKMQPLVCDSTRLSYEARRSASHANVRL